MGEDNATQLCSGLSFHLKKADEASIRATPVYPFSKYNRIFTVTDGYAVPSDRPRPTEPKSVLTSPTVVQIVAQPSEQVCGIEQDHW